MACQNRDPPTHPEYYVELINGHRFAISKLDVLTAHIGCLRIIT